MRIRKNVNDIFLLTFTIFRDIINKELMRLRRML